jgi:hypothetical protein
MGAMLDYGSGEAPTVALRGVSDSPERPDDVDSGRTHDLARRASDDVFLAPGRVAGPLRLPVAWLQAALAFLLPLLLVGTAILLRRDWRRTTLLLAISAYYLLSEGFFIFEWRVVMPMHYGLFVAAAAGMLLLWDLPVGLLARHRR